MTRAQTARIDDEALENLEREFVGRARGRVLEIGAGDGENFGALPHDVQWQGLEPDAHRRDELGRRAREWGHTSPLLAAGAESIPLPDGSVDTVVGTYVLCTVQDVAATLAEARRVLAPGGRIIFVDHVAAPRGTWKRGLQQLATPITTRVDHGCHWNRDPEPFFAAAGFVPIDVRRHEVTARPWPAVPTLFFEGRRPA
ncbi:class I SAM-dependent methyltransferase [Rathayibacter sp. YIM 133350]|uniref:class I SAM-dependent methyltransferase n=1 Tax=Rathayibacter sp. YIM 133350 TaxID=3131992 RepID=UPI00307E2D4A